MTDINCNLDLPFSTNPQETWLPVVGWETVYEVSDLGRVKRIKQGKHCRGDRGKIGRVLKHILGSHGYAAVHLRDWPRNSVKMVHLIVAKAFLGPPPEGHEVNHKDGDRMNPKLDNLEYLTRSDNHKHKYRVLKSPPICNKGEAAGRAKLSNEDVLEIRRLYGRGGVSQQRLADEYGVNQTMIGFIVRRANWTHI